MRYSKICCIYLQPNICLRIWSRNNIKEYIAQLRVILAHYFPCATCIHKYFPFPYMENFGKLLPNLTLISILFPSVTYTDAQIYRSYHFYLYHTWIYLRLFCRITQLLAHHIMFLVLLPQIYYQIIWPLPLPGKVWEYVVDLHIYKY